jgi:hypothetical protein
MKKMLKKIGIFFPILLLSIVLIPESKAASASSTWSLLTNQTSAVSGQVTASDMVISPIIAGTTFNNTFTGTTGWMRVGTTGGSQMPNGYTVTGYVEFSVSPVANNNMTITSVTANLAGGGSGGNYIAAYYSLSNFSSTPGTNLGTATYNGVSGKTTTYNAGMNLANTSSITVSAEGLTTFTPSIAVTSGQTLKVRLYCWNGTVSSTYTGSSTKYLAIKNVVISGTTTPWSEFSLTSTAGTNAQTTCINSPITDITYSLSNASGASFSGLPSGVTGSYSSGTVTISGTPSASGTFNYTVTPTGGSGSNTATGTITVNPLSTAPVITPVLLYEGDLSVSGTSTEADGTTITVYKNGSTAIGTGTVSSGAWTVTVPALLVDDVITAKATAANKCESVVSNSATAASNHLPTIGLLSGSNDQTAIAGNAIADVVYKWGGTAISASTVWTGSLESVPDGLLEVSDDGLSTFTISGTPQLPGTYHYTINSSDGTSSSSNLTGTFTVKLATPNVTSGATSITSTGFTARWAAVTGVTSYTVKVYLLGEEVVAARQTGVVGTSVDITGLSVNTTYTYKVEAIGDGLLVPNSNQSLASSNVKTLNTGKSIVSFSISGQHYSMLDEGAKTISVLIPAGISKSALTSSITVSSYASIDPVAGVTDFSSPVSYTVTAEDLSTTTYTVTVTNGSSSADHFRTIGTGNWSSYSTWESSSNNTDWISASIAPDSLATSVDIRHSIPLDVNSSARLLQIESGKTLTINAGMTLKIVDDATAEVDLKVPGYLLNKGTVTLGVGSTMSVDGTYEHNVNGGTVPTATWNTGSLCLVTGNTSSTALSGFSQNFYDFTFNCPNNSANFNFGMSNNTIAHDVNLLSFGSGTNTIGFTSAASTIGANVVTINGNLNITNTVGTSSVTAHRSGGVSTTTQVTINIMGNLNLNQGTLDLQVANGVTNNIYNVYGNFNFAGGTFKASNTGATFHFAKGSGVQTYTKSGGTYSASNPTMIVDNGSTLDLSNQLVDGAIPFTTVAGAALKTSLASGITGNLTTSGTKTLNALTNYIFNGSTAQVTGTGLTTAGTITVDNAAGLTFSNNTTATGLTINSGAVANVSANKQLTVSTTLSNSGTLNLLSDATGSATLLAPATLGGTGGVYHVQQYLTGSVNSGTGLPNGRFWYVTSPVAGATSAVIAPTTGNKLWSWVESGNSYAAVATDDVSLSKGIGYVARMKDNGAVQFTGTPYTGDVSVEISRTGSTNYYRGFNLIGNPYTSFATMSVADNVDIEPSIWYRTLTSDLANMAFDTYNFEGNTYVSGSGNGAISGNIPPMQAFWVKTHNVGTSNVVFKQANRSHQSAVRLRAAEADTVPCIRLQITNGRTKDQTLIGLYKNANDGFDRFDSHKMRNNIDSFPEIYTLNGAEELAINGLRHDGKTKTLALGFRTGKSGNFKLKVLEMRNLGDSVSVILKDKVKNCEKVLKDSTEYDFASEVATTTDRFSLTIVSSMPTALKQNPLGVDADAFTTNDHRIQVRLLGANDGNAAVYNALGQRKGVFSLRSAESVLDPVFAPGVYWVHVQAQGVQVTKKVVINQ